MVRALILNEAKLDEIAELVKRAVANPIPLATIKAGIKAGAIFGDDKTELSLSDRKPGFERPPSDHILIPRGYRMAFSVEEQPIGLCNHLSVSVDQPGRVPSVEAVRLIADACGMGWEENNPATGRWWLEEFDPGHHAVNLVTVRKEKK